MGREISRRSTRRYELGSDGQIQDAGLDMHVGSRISHDTPHGY